MAIAAYLLLSVAIGVGIVFQTGMNASLSGWVESPVRATLVNFVVGGIVVLAVVLVAFRGWPPASRLADAPWWTWLGGLLGASFVFGAVVAAPRLGVAVFIAATLAGQAVASLVVDHFGWVGFAQREITAGRVVGVALVALGVVLVRVF